MGTQKLSSSFFFFGGKEGECLPQGFQNHSISWVPQYRTIKTRNPNCPMLWGTYLLVTDFRSQDSGFSKGVLEIPEDEKR